MKIFNVVFTQLALDNQTAEAELERIINDSTIAVIDKTELIKEQLVNLANTEASIVRWKGYMPEGEEPKEDNKNNNN